MQTTGFAEATIDRLYEREALAVSLREARARTLRYYGHLDLAADVPQWTTVNLPRWELAHIAWFQEFWCLRDGARAEGSAIPPSRLARADDLFNSSLVPHASRWRLAYPSAQELRDYMARTLEETVAKLPHLAVDELYYAHLALVHEDMHGEALLMTLQQLGLDEPAGGVGDVPRFTAAARDVLLQGGEFTMGTADGPSFVFDNERTAHRAVVAPFRMSSRPVTQGEFACFVDEGGYGRLEWWDPAGRAWLAQTRRQRARFWQRRDDGWYRERFGVQQPVEPDAAMVHVNLHEARAWCAWAGRRLPTEAEWEFAARFASEDFVVLHGGVWQWTSTPFAPYPGFVAGPYRDYSQPWFHSHYVLRGGSFATQSRIATPTYRNFYLPERDDVFAGLRTCAI